MKSPANASRRCRKRHLLLHLHQTKAFSLWHLRSFRPSWRFPARLGWASGGSQLGQEFVHSPSHLLQCSEPFPILPRSKLRRHQITAEHQQIVRQGHNPTPQRELLGSLQPGLLPQQLLLIEAVAVFGGIKRNTYASATSTGAAC